MGLTFDTRSTVLVLKLSAEVAGSIRLTGMISVDVCIEIRRCSFNGIISYDSLEEGCWKARLGV